MTALKLILLAIASGLVSAQAQAQIGDYKKVADISSSDFYQVDVKEDLIYGVGKTDYRLLNANGTYDDVTEKNLELDLFVPDTPASVGKRAVIILLPAGGRSGCRNAREILLPDGTRDLANGCSQETIVSGDRVDQEGLNFNHLNNSRARQYAERGLVVASLVTRYRYEHREFDEDGSNRWFRTPDGTATGDNPRRLLTNLSAHLEFLVTDIKRSVRWLTANADQYNIDPNYIFIDGGSGAAKMASLATITDETQLIVDDPANIDVAFEQEHNHWDIRNSTPGIRGAILRSGDLNGLYHTDLMDTMSKHADSFMFWTGTADASIVHGMSEVLEDKCEILGTCFTQLYSLPNRTHGNAGSATFPHTITNDTSAPNHIYDFIVSTIHRDTQYQPTISIRQNQTSFSEASGRAQITIERTGNTDPEIQVTVTADQMREVTVENGDGGTFDLLTQFVAKSSNSDGLLMYDESTGYAYEDAFGGNLRPNRDRVLLHESGRGDGQFTEISSGDIEFHDIDFTGRTQTITIPSGETRVTFSVDIQDDFLQEDNECFKVRLLNAYGADIGNSMEVITIIDDDSEYPQSHAVCANPDYVAPVLPVPNISITPTTNSVDEGSNFVLSVRSDEIFHEDVAVEYQTVGGSATSENRDYIFSGNTAVIPAGSDSVDISIQTRQDTIVETDENFTVRLNGVSAGNAVISSNNSATITINDDDASLPNISITPINNNVEEGDSLTLSLHSDVIVTEDVAIDYQTVADVASSASRDYIYSGSTVVIPAGSDQVDISIQTRQDTDIETNESFLVRLNGISSDNALISAVDRAFIVIIDDDQPEAATPISPLTIAETSATDSPITVIEDDFVCGEPDFSSSADIGFFIWQDCAQSNDWFVRATAGGGSRIRYNALFRSNAVFNSVDPFSFEGTDNIELLSLDTQLDVTMTMSVNGVDGIQYSLPADSDLCLALADSNQIIYVGANRQAFTSPLNLRTLGAICEEEVPLLSVTDMAVSEEMGMAEVVVELNNAAEEPVSVSFTTVDDSARSSEDYDGASGVLEFPINQTRRTVSIPITDDNVGEGVETFKFTMANPVGASLLSQSSRISIIDNQSIACGEPSFSSSRDAGIFLWQDCDNSNQWFMRGTAGGGSAITYTGSITTDTRITLLDEFSFEGIDSANLSNGSSELEFLIRMSNGGVDGLDLSIPTGGTETCFDASSPVVVGRNNEVVTPPFNIYTLDPC